MRRAAAGAKAVNGLRDDEHSIFWLVVVRAIGRAVIAVMRAAIRAKKL